MIFITGDTHGDFTRFSSENFPEQKDMTKEDFVIICGDFGGVWDGSRRERYWLDWLEDKPFTTLFVSGNHENYDLLAGYPVEHWHGGKVQPIRASLLHLTRGQFFQIGGKRIFTMGGPPPTTLPTAFWTRPRRTSAPGKSGWMPAGPSTGSTGDPGGRRNCPARRSIGRRSETWTPAADRWTLWYPTAAPPAWRIGSATGRTDTTG